MTPVIAIPKLGPGLQRLYFRYTYESALKAAGAKVRWIGPENIGSVIDCDGLLIPGGDDIDPKFYGQSKSQLCGKQNPLRDQLDPALLKAFLPTGKPILGICRGMQMLNVHLGGTLHQDIKSLQTVCHQQPKAQTKVVHTANVTEGSRLHRILGKNKIGINSLHHQAADKLGKDLAVCAMSEDGFVEAMELQGHPFCLGLQWHPEMMARKFSEHKAILLAFVKECQ